LFVPCGGLSWLPVSFLLHVKYTVSYRIKNILEKMTADQRLVVHGLSNRAILNDLERPQTQISRTGHSLTLNISKMVTDTAIVTMEGE